LGQQSPSRRFEALIVSGETRSSRQAVDGKRVEQGWHALDVFEVDVLNAEEMSDEPIKTENFASNISSSVFRQQRAARLDNLFKGFIVQPAWTPDKAPHPLSAALAFTRGVHADLSASRASCSCRPFVGLVTDGSWCVFCDCLV
jgi:hypothetical protein